MTKADLITALSVKLNMSKAEAGRTLDAFTSLFVDELVADGQTSLPGVGVLSVHERAERMGHNPQNGAELVIPARNVVRFRASKVLKDAVQ